MPLERYLQMKQVYWHKLFLNSAIVSIKNNLPKFFKVRPYLVSIIFNTIFFDQQNIILHNNQLGLKPDHFPLPFFSNISNFSEEFIQAFFNEIKISLKKLSNNKFAKFNQRKIHD